MGAGGVTRVLAHPAPYTAAAVLAAGLLGWLLGWVTYRAVADFDSLDLTGDDRG